MVLYEVLSVVGLGIGTIVSQLPYVWYYVVKCSFKLASPGGTMYFMCLIFSLSGFCELLFLLCFIASWT